MQYAETNCAENKSDALVARKMERLRRIPGMDVDQGIAYCANDEEFYLSMLRDYLDADRSRLLREAYEAKDWDAYQLQAHSLKSTSYSIGAMTLGDQAKTSELRLKEGDSQKAAELHESLVEHYEMFAHLLEEILSGEA